MKPGMQQGHADGMCGLYAILSFLAHTEEWRSEEPNTALRYVLDAVQAEGWLSPYLITTGFESYQLASILNRLFDNYHMRFRATQLAALKKQSSSEDFFGLASRVVAQGCSIIGGPDGRDHWVLVTQSEGRPVVFNSADAKRPMKAFDKRQPDYCVKNGVLIMPWARAQVEVDF